MGMWDSITSIGSGLLGEIGSLSGLATTAQAVGGIYSAVESANAVQDYADIVAGSAAKQDALSDAQWAIAKPTMEAQALAATADANAYNDTSEARAALNTKELALQKAGLDVMGKYAYDNEETGEQGIQSMYYENMLGDISAYGDTQETRDSILTQQYANQLTGQELNADLLTSQAKDLATYDENRGIIEDYYKQSAEGLDVGEQVKNAKADVASAFAGSNAANSRSMARMGVNPNSGAFADKSRLNATSKAQAMGAAANSARTQAEATNYARLASASDVLKGSAPAGTNATLQAQNTGLGLYTAGTQQGSNFSGASVAGGLNYGSSNNAISGLANTAAQAANAGFSSAASGLASLMSDGKGNVQDWANTSIFS